MGVSLLVGHGEQAEGREVERGREKGGRIKTPWRATNEPKYVQGLESPRGRSDSRGSGLALCCLEERWTGGEHSRSVTGRRVPIGWGWGGGQLLFLAGWSSCWWPSGVLLCDRRTFLVLGLNHDWGLARMVQGNVFSKTWLRTWWLLSRLFLQWFWICRMS